MEEELPLHNDYQDEPDAQEQEDGLQKEKEDELQQDREMHDEISVSQFQQFAKENFQTLVEKDYSYEEVINTSTVLTSFFLPMELCEIFLDDNSIKLYPLFVTPELVKHAEWLREQRRRKGGVTENFDDIKNYYLRWVIAVSEKDQEYYALSTINLLQNNAKSDNFIKYLMLALIALYDKKNQSFEAAEDNLEAARSIVKASSLETAHKDQILYYLKIIEGVIFIKKKDLEAAIDLFQALRNEKTNALNALYYGAMLQNKVGNPSRAADAINEIVELDVHKLNYALRVINLKLFAFFLKNAGLYEVLREPIFANLTNQLKRFVDNRKTEETSLLMRLLTWADNLKSVGLQDYYDKQIKGELKFIEEFVGKYSGSKNSFLLIVCKQVVDKFHGVLERIQNNIRNVFTKRINKELVMFDEKIRDAEDEMMVIRNDIENRRNMIIEQYEENRETVEHRYQKLLLEMEVELSEFDTSEEYDPRNMFMRAMTNNILVSGVMVVIGGLLGIISEGFFSKVDASTIFFSFITSGIQYGAIIFILGVVVSGLVVMRGKNEARGKKRKMERKLERFKKQKKDELGKLEIDFETKKELLEKSANERLQNLQRQVDKTKEERAEREEALREEHKEEMEQILKALDKVSDY